MIDDDDVLSKSRLASELGLTTGRISQYIARGMPTRRDGLVSRRAAIAWMKDNVDPARSPAVMRLLSPSEAAEQAAPPRFPHAIAHHPVQERRPDLVRQAVLETMCAAITVAHPIAANAVLIAGGRLEQAVCAADIAVLALWEALQRHAKACGYLRPQEELGCPAELADWHELAARAGEPYDPEAWGAFCEAAMRRATGLGFADIQQSYRWRRSDTGEVRAPSYRIGAAVRYEESDDMASPTGGAGTG